MKKLRLTTTNYLIIANIFWVFFLIYFSNLALLPLSFDNFTFIALLVFLFALYRPGWAFLFFIGVICLENINLAPEQLGITLRPFQFIGALTFLAVFCRFLVKRLNFQMPKLSRLDFLLTIFLLGSFLSAVFSQEKSSSFKLSVILFSFFILYFLVRIFVQSFEDLKKVIPFFLSSALVVSFYAIWQNIRFSQGLESFAVMPGRPNATFAEPDWLGIYLVFCIAVIFSTIYYFRKSKSNNKSLITDDRLLITILFLSLVTFFLSLILTVSRSAWLGAFIVFVVYATIIFTNLKSSPRHWRFKEIVWHKSFVFSALALAIFLIYIFNLTTFKLLERAQSTGGNQIITISCNSEDEGMKIKQLQQIERLEQLEQFNCRHINLEEIEKEKSQNKFVTEILRPDPNTNIRKNIYQKSWQEIKTHPIFGIGWGAIGKTLGTDERGENLNASNIFLELWLGSGLLGLLSFLAIWLFIFFRAIINFSGKNPEEKIISLFLILGLIALAIPNLFNAGIFLGILWLFIGISLI